ncbi:MAG: hypothetical protein AUG51_13360 [Acidobacteria bacterium 13_1_20CM_3_53_8]|nr:MAG: hypothetical protein AUG51_13360 [Acidobacteria bacterium 13_1_20CM_3_53_8]
MKLAWIRTTGSNSALSELKHFPLRLCVNPQFSQSSRFILVAGSRKGAKKRAKTAKRERKVFA